jgi:hypothetical protein
MHPHLYSLVLIWPIWLKDNKSWRRGLKQIGSRSRPSGHKLRHDLKMTKTQGLVVWLKC